MSLPFSDRAQKVMQLAKREAQRFNHEYIGTEHLLLGLIKHGNGVAASVLKNLDIDLRKIRIEVEKLIQRGPDKVIVGTLPKTPGAKRAIELSKEEASNLKHNYVGTEHLLLGLLREQEGVAAHVLMNLGLKLEVVREEVLNLLGYGLEGQSNSAPKPRRFRFGLRTLFAIMLVACVAGFGLRELRRRRQDEFDRQQVKQALKDAWLRNEREPGQPVPLR